MMSHPWRRRPQRTVLDRGNECGTTNDVRIMRAFWQGGLDDAV